MSTLRVLFISALLTIIAASLLPLQLLALSFRWPLRDFLPQLFHRIACGLIGIRIKVIGRPTNDSARLIVSNHASWIDILAISATTTAVFIAKHEVSSWPIIGLLARLQRTVFVDRQRRSATGEVNGQIARRLADGDHVVLFAEGTSSDGSGVLPFKSALIGAAGHAIARDGGRSHIVVQPLSIAYTGFGGVRLSQQDRCRIAWYGDMPFLPHIVGVLRTGAIDLTLTWGKPVLYKAGSDRKAIARELETTVRTLTVTALSAAG
jgi:1-acyl-sn-glycerol-3-phosphate acyltransferase